MKKFLSLFVLFQGTVDEESVVFADNVISCQFTRSESTAGDSEFYDISGDNQYYILLAVGDQINMDGKDFKGSGHY